jgi:hypothetical protein
MEKQVNYLVVGLETGISWPMTPTDVPYAGDIFSLLPATADTYPCVALPFEAQHEYENALARMRRFLSALSWVHCADIREEEIRTGRLPHAILRPRTVDSVISRFPTDNLPEPTHPDARRALALFRQGLSVNSVPFQFLSFANVLNIRLADSKGQIQWINKNLSGLDDWDASKRLSDLQQSASDIGDYLYRSGRCAVAHANRVPVVDPDDPADWKRLRDDLPLMKALAQRFIEDEFGIQTQRTIWREHRYELAGFGTLLGPSIVERVKAHASIKASEYPSLPPLSVRLRGYPLLPSFESLRVVPDDARGGAIRMFCKAQSGLLAMFLVLDFANERLRFDPVLWIQVIDDGSISALDACLDWLGLQRGLLHNAQLEVWNQDANTLVSRTNPFIPVNIDSGRSIENINAVSDRLAVERNRRQAAPTG